MRSTLRTTLIIAAAVACLGLIMIITGAAFGGAQAVSIDSDGINVAEKGSSPAIDQNYANITDLDLNVDVRDVKLEKGTSYNVKCDGSSKSNKLTVEENNGRVTITEKESTHDWFGFNFSLVSWLFNGGSHKTITITYPEKGIQNVSIESDAGSVEVSDLNSNDLYVNSDVGSIDLKNVKTVSLDTDSDTGDIDLKDVTSETVKFKSDVGSFDAENLNTKSVNGESSTGSTDISGKVLGPITIKGDVGSIDLELEGKESDYSYELSTDVGSTEVDGNSAGGSMVKEYPNKPKLSLTTDTGSITVDFK